MRLNARGARYVGGTLANFALEIAQNHSEESEAFVGAGFGGVT